MHIFSNTMWLIFLFLHQFNHELNALSTGSTIYSNLGLINSNNCLLLLADGKNPVWADFLKNKQIRFLEMSESTRWAMKDCYKRRTQQTNNELARSTQDYGKWIFSTFLCLFWDLMRYILKYIAYIHMYSSHYSENYPWANIVWIHT